MYARMTFALGLFHTNKWDGNSVIFFQILHSAQLRVSVEYLEMNHICLAIPCAQKKTRYMAALYITHVVDAQMYTQPFSLLDTD